MEPPTRQVRLALVAQQPQAESPARQQQPVVVAQLALVVLVVHRLCQLPLPGSKPQAARVAAANSSAHLRRGLMAVLRLL